VDKGWDSIAPPLIHLLAIYRALEPGARRRFLIDAALPRPREALRAAPRATIVPLGHRDIARSAIKERDRALAGRF